MDELAADCVSVLPLIMNGVRRTIGFRRDGDHMTSTSTEVAGFVPMQGAGRHPERVLVLPGGDGHAAKLRLDSGVPPVTKASSTECSRRLGPRSGRGHDQAPDLVRRSSSVVRLVPAGLLPADSRRRD